jgi:hypothetical protein
MGLFFLPKLKGRKYLRKGTRLLSLLLALIMSIGVFSGLATTAFAASTDDAVMLDLPRGGGNSSLWGHAKSISWAAGRAPAATAIGRIL